MRIVFMGTPEFAVPSLEALLGAGEEIVAVYTQPDRPAGRGQKLTPPPVKVKAQERGLKVRQPESLREEVELAALEALEPDLLVVAAYGQILTRRALAAAGIMPVNVHASLLPSYRGAAPIQWAVARGETETGISIMRMARKLDAGDVLLVRSEPILPDDTAGSLHDRLAALGANCLLESLELLKSGAYHLVPQDESLVTWAPPLTKEDARLDWNQPARTLHNLIRGMSPWPLAHCLFRGAPFKVLRASLAEESGAPAEPGRLLLRGGRLLAQAGDGAWLELKEVQLPGRGPVAGMAFANGARLSQEDRLG